VEGVEVEEKMMMYHRDQNLGHLHLHHHLNHPDHDHHEFAQLISSTVYTL
jgi:ribosomal protein L32